MVDDTDINSPPPVSPRRRLQILQAIPDNQRTEAEWDEIVELEISLAPGNRIGQPMPGSSPGSSHRSDRPKQHKGPPQKAGPRTGDAPKPRRHKPMHKKTP